MSVKTKSTAKKTTITKEIIKQAEQLSGKAYGVTMIADALGIAYRTCFNNKDLSEAIKRGQSQARQKIVDDLMTRSEGDQSSAATIYLSKQMKCFTTPYTTVKPKTIEEASDRIVQIYADAASGLIDEERGKYLIGFLESYIKSVEVGDLENRIKQLEENQDGK